MRDYFYITESGERIPVAQMNEVDIDAILFDGDVEIHADDFGETKEQVLERLRIEKIVRHLDKQSER